jgi:hypothetical protein
MALSKAEGPFGRPFDRLTVLSEAEGSMLSNVEATKGCVTLIPRPVKFSLRETAKPI